MTLSDKKLEELKRILMKPGVDVELIPTYSGICRLLIWKGFEIMQTEKVMHSKNPITAFAQDMSALFRMKEHPPTEYSVVITAIPDDTFNHLLNREERIEYPTGLTEEKKEELRGEVSGKILDAIGQETINFLKKYYIEFGKKIPSITEIIKETCQNNKKFKK